MKTINKNIRGDLRVINAKLVEANQKLEATKQKNKYPSQVKK